MASTNGYTPVQSILASQGSCYSRERTRALALINALIPDEKYNDGRKRGPANRTPTTAGTITHYAIDKVKGLDPAKENFVKSLPPNTVVCICWFADCCDPKFGQNEYDPSSTIYCKFCRTMYDAQTPSDGHKIWIPCRTPQQIEKIVSVIKVVAAVDPVTGMPTGEVLETTKVGVSKIASASEQSGVTVFAKPGQFFLEPVDEPTTPKASRGPCRFFNTPQGCTNALCKFQHSNSYVPSSTARTSSSSAPLSSPATQKQCDHFNTSQGCKFGKKCKFAHVKPVVSVPVCQYFNTAKGCKYGDECKFSHQ